MLDYGEFYILQPMSTRPSVLAPANRMGVQQSFKVNAASAIAFSRGTCLLNLAA